MQNQNSNISVSQGHYQWLDPEFGTRYSGPLPILKKRVTEDGVQVVPQVAYFENMYKTESGTVVTILQIVRMMMRNSLKAIGERIKAARIAGDDKLKSQLKSSLPCFSHAGVIIPRRNECLIQPSFTYQLDIDRLPDPGKILQQIIEDQQLEVLFAAISPSGNGVKALLFLKELMYLRESWPWENYRQAYHKATAILSQYFRETYHVQIDEQMKSISQPFYLFHAPDLFVHPNLSPWI